MTRDTFDEILSALDADAVICECCDEMERLLGWTCERDRIGNRIVYKFFDRWGMDLGQVSMTIWEDTTKWTLRSMKPGLTYEPVPTHLEHDPVEDAMQRDALHDELYKKLNSWLRQAAAEKAKAAGDSSALGEDHFADLADDSGIGARAPSTDLTDEQWEQIQEADPGADRLLIDYWRSGLDRTEIAHRSNVGYTKGSITTKLSAWRRRCIELYGDEVGRSLIPQDKDRKSLMSIDAC